MQRVSRDEIQFESIEPDDERNLREHGHLAFDQSLVLAKTRTAIVDHACQDHAQVP